MQVEALVCFLQVYVTSLAKGYFESCALRLRALPALLACAARQPSVFNRPRGVPSLVLFGRC
jgi:hypothetical protein